MLERARNWLASGGSFAPAVDSEAVEPEDELLMREVTPLEGTRMSLWNSILPDFYASLSGSAPLFGDASLAERVWVAARCQHMNASQIAAMPIRFHGTDEPAWVSSPDPSQFPNGIGEATYAIVDALYGWGYSLQYVVDTYADGYPRRWTVIPSSACTPRFGDDGRKVYKVGDKELDPTRVIQIDRTPTTAAHGTSALRAYVQPAYGLLAAANQSSTVSQGGIPQAVLKSDRKLTAEQALAIQTQWADATTRRNGLPPVLPPELAFEVLSINPADLALLETQEWDARVLATAYGVPAVLLNMSLQGGLTYQNPMALMQMWWLTELRTTAKRVVDAWSAQLLPSGQFVSVDASDITSELDSKSADDDPQAAAESSQVAKASPVQQHPLTAIGGGRG